MCQEHAQPKHLLPNTEQSESTQQTITRVSIQTRLLLEIKWFISSYETADYSLRGTLRGWGNNCSPVCHVQRKSDPGIYCPVCVIFVSSKILKVGFMN